jgi:hypothetical protein
MDSLPEPMGSNSMMIISGTIEHHNFRGRMENGMRDNRRVVFREGKRGDGRVFLLRLVCFGIYLVQKYQKRFSCWLSLGLHGQNPAMSKADWPINLSNLGKSLAIQYTRERAVEM